MQLLWIVSLALIYNIFIMVCCEQQIHSRHTLMHDRQAHTHTCISSKEGEEWCSSIVSPPSTPLAAGSIDAYRRSTGSWIDWRDRRWTPVTDSSPPNRAMDDSAAPGHMKKPSHAMHLGQFSRAVVWTIDLRPVRCMQGYVCHVTLTILTNPLLP